MEPKVIMDRAGQRPCKWKQSSLHTERRGIIVGENPTNGNKVVTDSLTGETFVVPGNLVKEVTLFGPEDMPNDEFLKQYFGES